MKLTFTIILLVISGLNTSRGDGNGIKGHNLAESYLEGNESECSDSRFKEAELAAYKELLQARADAANVLKDEISSIEEKYKGELSKLNSDYQNALNKCGDSNCTLTAKQVYDQGVGGSQVAHDEGIFVAQGKEQTTNEDAQEKYNEAVAEARRLYCSEACDGQWQGTVTYTYIVTFTSKQTNSPPASAKPGAGSTGSSSSQDLTTTHSGTITADGNDWQANSAVDQISISDKSSSGNQYCHGGLGGPKGGLVSSTQNNSLVGYASGSSQGKLSDGLSLDKDGYRISIKPLSINALYKFTDETSVSGGCGGERPSPSFSNSLTRQYGVSDSIVGRASYGPDRNILSRTDTKTTPGPPSSSQTGGGNVATTTTTVSTTTVATITWNLQRCIRSKGRKPGGSAFLRNTLRPRLDIFGASGFDRRGGDQGGDIRAALFTKVRNA